jgi:hypothetical protein
MAGTVNTTSSHCYIATSSKKKFYIRTNLISYVQLFPALVRSGALVAPNTAAAAVLQALNFMGMFSPVEKPNIAI